MTRSKLLRWIWAFGLAALASAPTGCGQEAAPEAPAPAPKRPNILLIVADDMGYADLGAFGGEVETPTLDALAARGLRAANFSVNPTCSPTRAALLTGADNHVAGFGNMDEFVGPEQKGKPGYEGYLNERVVSVAKVLRDAGYHTYMAGKWHLGYAPEHWPAGVGFERDFTLLQGGGSNWADMMYPDPAHPQLNFTLDGKPLEKLPEDHFSSAAFADYIIEAVSEQADDRPFFAFLSFQAVHAPFAAPDDWLDRFEGKYDAGYDAIRAQRIERMKQLGLLGANANVFPRLPDIPAWDQLTPEQQKSSARKMEVYAAMLANMDFHIGRVLDHLEQSDRLDDTLVVFLSDNGAESIEFEKLVELNFSADALKWVEAKFDMRPESWGRKGSVVDYGPAWAQVGMGPFAFFKAFVTEGGIRSPLIVAGPGVAQRGDITQAVLHVTDLVPTFLDLAGVAHPSTQPGSPLAPLRGRSLRPLLEGRADAVRGENDWLAWELFGNRAVRQGDWKLVSLVKGAGGDDDWHLYNLEDDPAELHDLSTQHPERRAAMIALWEQYAKDNGVIYTGDGMFKPRAGASASH